jgi:hypothetical protein
MTDTTARPEITLAETAELVACLVTAHGLQFLHVDGRQGLSSLLAMEPLTVHAAAALTLLQDTGRAVSLSLAGHWALPEDVAGRVVQFAMAVLPEAMATAEASVVYARKRQDEVWDDKTNHACDDLRAVIDAVDRNLVAGRRMTAGMAPRALTPSGDQRVLIG